MKQAHQYDIGIIGGGCAGLQLLHALSSHSTWQGQKVLLVSDDFFLKRSWCFWSDNRIGMHHLVTKSWQNICFRSDDFQVTQNIAPYQYNYINGDDFFDYFKNDFLAKNKNIEVINAEVKAVNKVENGFNVNAIAAQWNIKEVFSNIEKVDYNTANVTLWQHFLGWFIEVEKPIFDETTLTMMDFSIAQHDDVRFVYVLPFSATTALVEMTVFSKQKSYTDDVYQAILIEYMAKNFPNIAYKITEKEKGIIPMSDAKSSFEGKNGEILIGTSAGMVKPTTGYAFLRIMTDSRLIAQGFYDKLCKIRLKSRWRFQFYDKILLGILDEKPMLGKTIFSRLFKHSDMRTVLRFLDEKTNIWEEVKIFATLPIYIFLRQTIKIIFK